MSTTPPATSSMPAIASTKIELEPDVGGGAADDVTAGAGGAGDAGEPGSGAWSRQWWARDPTCYTSSHSVSQFK
jgi:hypothetical protein